MPNFTNPRIGCNPQATVIRTAIEDFVLRIALVIERFTPAAGGVESVAWQVAHELDRSGVDVTILTREAHAGSSKDTRAGPSVQILRASTLWQPLRVLGFSAAATRAVRAGAYDIVHSFSRTRHQDLYRAGGGSHREYLQRSHSRSGRRLRRLSPRHRVLLSIEKAIFNDSSQRIQCASRFVADTLIENHGVSRDRIFLLPNAVDASRFGTPEASAAGRRLRAEVDEKAEQIWLFPASGWQRKGLIELFESFARCRDPGIRLWIAGRDDPRRWKRLAASLGIADRVRFLGHRDDLEIVYGAVDGMILPTRYDAFANVTLEAAISGLPIVTTDANGAAEWLGEAIVRVSDPTDSAALAEILQRGLDPHWRRRLGDEARRKAQAMDWPGHVAKLCEEYRRILRLREESKARQGVRLS